MKKPLLALLLVCLSAASATAQTSAQTARSDEILKKVAQLDALIQIVPLALTKEQISPLLTAIEKVRQKQKELYVKEATDLTGIEPKVSKVVDDGINKSVYPPRETQNEIAAFMRAEDVRRQVFYGEMVDDMYVVCKATLNEGQLKAMEKSLKPELLGATQKASEMDSETKVKFFIRKVLLDPIAYDVLVQMSRRKDDAKG